MFRGRRCVEPGLTQTSQRCRRAVSRVDQQRGSFPRSSGVDDGTQLPMRERLEARQRGLGCQLMDRG